MERFEVLILGCGSAKPSARHFPSSQLVDVHDKLYMVDCGEGAQIQMCRNHAGFRRMTAVFITHLHGDHVFGLPGLLSTFNLLSRTAPLDVYGPEGLGEMISAIMGGTLGEMTYEVRFHPVDTTRHCEIMADRTVSVWSVPLRHRLPCCGYLVCERPALPHIRRDMVDYYGIPAYALSSIKQGQPWTTPEGDEIPAARLTTPAAPPRRYAYLSDTAYIPQLAETLSGVDLLYHEATFGRDCEKRARETFHSTAAQAATLARDAKVGRLVIGHYSSRYDDENALLSEAREIFPNTELADENKIFKL